MDSYRKSYNAEKMRDSDVIREATDIMTKDAVEEEMRAEIADSLRFRIVAGLDQMANNISISPAVRVRAFELLGKMTDVGLYRKANTANQLNNATAQELEDRLMLRLGSLLTSLVDDSTDTSHAIPNGGTEDQETS